MTETPKGCACGGLLLRLIDMGIRFTGRKGEWFI